MPSAPIKDTMIALKLVTPGGLMISIDPDHFPTESVRRNIESGDDELAVLTIRQMTGCSATIERTNLTTAGV